MSDAKTQEKQRRKKGKRGDNRNQRREEEKRGEERKTEKGTSPLAGLSRVPEKGRNKTLEIIRDTVGEVVIIILILLTIGICKISFSSSIVLSNGMILVSSFLLFFITTPSEANTQ